MSADCGLQLFLRDIGALYNNLISHHDSRSYRQVQLKLVIRQIFGFRFGYGFDVNVISSTQTGYHFFEMLSWLTIWSVKKEFDLEHVLLLLILMDSDTIILYRLPGLFLISIVAHHNWFPGFRHSNQKLICWYKIDQTQIAPFNSLTI